MKKHNKKMLIKSKITANCFLNYSLSITYKKISVNIFATPKDKKQQKKEIQIQKANKIIPKKQLHYFFANLFFNCFIYFSQ
ncbi:hypothetical protein ['Chrysanthemum coronarium' phytoplasma]|uniref:hypothetical protein n=1 Tax='Chrysanthemum coronarium' phytoplasma TaxID=1520703 RepID=UPI0005AAFFA8|nr:hypothetical protein ['Chrysanthemum coronarium' phytoplasma]